MLKERVGEALMDTVHVGFRILTWQQLFENRQNFIGQQGVQGL